MDHDKGQRKFVKGSKLATAWLESHGIEVVENGETSFKLMQGDKCVASFSLIALDFLQLLSKEIGWQEGEETAFMLSCFLPDYVFEKNKNSKH